MLRATLLRRLNISRLGENIRAESVSIPIISILMGIMGLLNVIVGLAPSLADRLIPLKAISLFYISQGEAISDVFSGLALLLLAHSLRRSKRIAWAFTLGLLMAATVDYLGINLNYPKAILAGGLAVWLLFLEPHFYIRSDMNRLTWGVRALGLIFTMTIALGMACLYILAWNEQVVFESGEALRHTAMMFAQFYDPVFHTANGLERLYMTSIYTIGAISMANTLILSLRPVQLQETANSVERERARQIVEAYGRSSMACMALLEDKAYYFSPGGSLVAYTVWNGVAVTLADPIGPPDDIEMAIAGFLAFCRLNDWRPAFCLTLPDYLVNYRRAGFRSLCLGHEAVVNLRTFTLAGRACKSFRKRYHRLSELGYRLVFHPPPVPVNVIAELRCISDEWLAMAYGSEKRFFLGWFDDDYIRSTLVAVVHAPDGRIDAFANLASEYQLNEITIDMIRHRKDMRSGTMDFLFVALFQWASEQGYDSFNLGLSALHGVGDHPGDPRLEKIIHRIYTASNSFYDFKGLHGFKSKFLPSWEPQYIVFPGLFSLPVSLMAMVQANAGSEESFWQYFRPKRKSIPQEVAEDEALSS